MSDYQYQADYDASVVNASTFLASLHDHPAFGSGARDVQAYLLPYGQIKSVGMDSCGVMRHVSPDRLVYHVASTVDDFVIPRFNQTLQVARFEAVYDAETGEVLASHVRRIGQ